MDPNELRLKKLDLVEHAHRAAARGLQTNTGGNLSVRLVSAEAIIIKPSGVGFAECSPETLMIVGIDGTILEGSLKPSKDLDFHLEIYRIRPEVGAVMHVHSPWATGWASTGREVPCVTIHSKAKLKRIPLVSMAPGGKAQTAAEVRPILSDTSVVAAVFENHGTVGVGKTLRSALAIAELIEETAHIAAVREMIAAAPRGLKPRATEALG